MPSHIERKRNDVLLAVRVPTVLAERLDAELRRSIIFNGRSDFTRQLLDDYFKILDALPEETPEQTP